MRRRLIQLLDVFREDADHPISTIKVAQDLLRHANSRTTLGVYTHAVSQEKRDANTKVVELLLPGRVLKAHTFQHLRLSKKKVKGSGYGSDSS